MVPERRHERPCQRLPDETRDTVTLISVQEPTLPGADGWVCAKPTILSASGSKQKRERPMDLSHLELIAGCSLLLPWPQDTALLEVLSFSS